MSCRSSFSFMAPSPLPGCLHGTRPGRAHGRVCRHAAGPEGYAVTGPGPGGYAVTRPDGGLRTAVEPQPPDDLPHDVGGRVIVIDHDHSFGGKGRFDRRQLAVEQLPMEEMAVPALQP